MELLFGLKLKYVKVPVSLIEHQMVWKYFQWGNSFGLQGFSAPLLCKNSFFLSVDFITFLHCLTLFLFTSQNKDPGYVYG